MPTRTNSQTRPASTTPASGGDNRSRALVWLNESESRIFLFGSGPDEGEKDHVDATSPHRRIHPRARSGGSARDNRDFFEAILAEVTEVDEWLIAASPNIAQEFEKYVRVGHAEALAKKLVGVETMDQPTDAKLLAFAQRRF